MMQLIVEYQKDTDAEAIIKMGKVKYHLPLIHAVVVEVDEKKYNLSESSIKGMKGISVFPTMSISAQMNYARKAVKAEQAQKDGIAGRKIGIAIMDTGVAPVKDLSLPKNRIIAFMDLINGKKKPYDDNGHGTQVAGICTLHFYFNKLWLL